EELDGDKNSHIEIDVTNGPVTVYITDDFELGESALVSIVGGGSRDVTFKSIQTKKIDLSRYASLSGTVIAPHAKFNAMSYVYFRGAIYARDIEFGNGVTALHHDAPAVAPKVIAGEENAAGSDLIPVAYALEQNYPNPFNPSTTIRFSLAEAGTVSLKIYNVRGQLVKTLLSSSLEAGSHQVNWNGLNQQGSQVASGVYFYHLQAGSFQQIKKMILMK
ncbi:MAG: T9SS type A sorting domain-containing protein, partial [Calditrichaeota bacterium]|nr:T9SS type A sorting domain-containing protein [Calditrichota bacterium]